MGDDLAQLPFVVQFSRKTRQTVTANIVFALAAGLAALWMAVVADVGASLAVILNGIRLRRMKRSKLTMQEIIDWLQGIEQLACDLYDESCTFFEQDEAFSAFLHKLAEDEAWHFHMMGSAADYLRKQDVKVTAAIALTQATRKRIESPLRRSCNSLSEQTLSKKQMIESLVEAEFGEWNDIFLYVTDTLQQYNRTFQYVAARIQGHQRRIERFVDTLPEELKPVRDMREMPAVWENKFLIVEDDAPLRFLLGHLLDEQGNIEMVENGKQALQKTRDHFFNVIISDVDMPVMNGLEFYREAAKENPDIRQHFVFCSGGITPDRKAFFKKHKLRYVEKPFGVDAFLQVIDGVMKNAVEL